jgi:hypothetical protein
MELPADHHDQLEVALMHRSLDALAASCERCGACGRALLIGERVYDYAAGSSLCELCRDREPAAPDGVRRIRGPEFGHTMKLLDRRPRRRARTA